MSSFDFRTNLRASPFTARIEQQSLVESWSGWNGYKTPRVLDTLASEYFAVRSSCSVMDLTRLNLLRLLASATSSSLIILARGINPPVRFDLT